MSDLFGSTAEYCARYRPGYPPDVLDHLGRSFNLNGISHLLYLRLRHP